AGARAARPGGGAREGGRGGGPPGRPGGGGAPRARAGGTRKGRPRQPRGRRRQAERPGEADDQGSDSRVRDDVDQVVAERPLAVERVVQGEGPGGEWTIGRGGTVTRHPRGGEQESAPRQRGPDRLVLEDRVRVVEHEAIGEARDVREEGQEGRYRRPACEHAPVHRLSWPRARRA